MGNSYDSELAKKLNLKSGMKTRVVDGPADADLGGLATTEAAEAEGLLVFVKTLADAELAAAAVVEAARAGRVTWMAYPKARQLGTDLNRDILWKYMRAKGVEAVRQIAVDDTWSAMRFRASG